MSLAHELRNTKLYVYFYCHAANKEVLMEIGPKLRELRIAKNLTQEELADRAELSKGSSPSWSGTLLLLPSPPWSIFCNAWGLPSMNSSAKTRKNRSSSHYEDYFEKEDTELLNKTEWIIPNAQKNMMELSASRSSQAVPPTGMSPMKGRNSDMC